MARTEASAQRNFTGGEISPNLDARADITRFRAALKECENFVVLAQGGMTRRSGFRDVHAALAASTLVPFVFSATDGYALEFGVGTMRAFRDFGILVDGADPFELATSFTADEIALLRYAQQADVMFLSTGKRPVQILKRLAETDWTIEDAVFRNGPFLDENIDDGVTISSDAAGEMPKGTDFNLAANTDLWTADNVGGLILIRAPDGNKYSVWQPEIDGAPDGIIRRWGNNWYKKVGAAIHNKGGTEPPVHLVGVDWDGDEYGGNAIKWQFLHSGWGIAKITGYTDARHVSCQAITYIPDEVQGDGTWRWAEGAWSTRRGFPKLVGFHKGRFYAAATDYQPTTVWGSCIDDYTNMDAINVTDDKALKYTMAAREGQVNFPAWLCSFRVLGIGTAGDECTLQPADGTRIAPDNVEIAEGTSEGSAYTNAVKVDGPVFISRDRKRIHEMGYDINQSDYVAPDLTIAADHITGPGVTKLAWMRDPYRTLFAVRDDGVLASCTLRKDQDINGWHRQVTVKGAVEDIACVPAPDGTRMDLWAIVTRTLAAGTVRRVESLMPFIEPLLARGVADVTDSFFVDCGYVYDGVPATNISGLDILNGETVSILADGKVKPPQVVAAGAIVLDVAASKVIVGLPMTARAKSLRYDKDAGGGKLSGKSVRVNQVTIAVRNAGGVNIQSGSKQAELLNPPQGYNMGVAVPLFSGIYEPVPLEAAWDEGGEITLSCDQPLPATILAWTPNAQQGA